MRDSGGHGGSSYSEINVPLLFLGQTCEQKNEIYNQIDIPATLSILFGLPIPASSIGNIIPNMLSHLTMEQKLYTFYYNGERLLKKLIQLNGIHATESEGNDLSTSCILILIANFSINNLYLFFPVFYTQFTDAKNAHKLFLHRNRDSSSYENDLLLAFKLAERNYIASSEVMSQRLSDSFINFDLISIIIGLICLVTVSNDTLNINYYLFMSIAMRINICFFFRHFFA